jgi:hypothetical protein
VAGIPLWERVLMREAATLDVPLVELVDRLLNRGVVLTGELTISVAGVDLIYLGLSVVLTSVETIRGAGAEI